MLSPSFAFAWVLWRQHRWGLFLVLSGLLLAATLAALVPVFCPPHVVEITFGVVILPLVSLTVYPVIIFTYGFDAGDLLARESCFPTSLLRLPLRTRTLVLWPMALGAATAFLLWLATCFFIFRPWLNSWQAEMPLWWPSMMAVAILAWFQALFWMPFGLPWLRAVLVLTMVQCMIAVPIYGLQSGVSEHALVGLFASLAVIAWALGYLGVQQARRGNVPDWEWVLSAPSQLFGGQSRNRQPFASPASAQMWFEWRLSGKTLPIVTGFLLPIAFLPLIFHHERDRGAVPSSLLCAVAVPLFFSGAAGWMASRRSRWVQGRSRMMPFIATLPMTTADMVGAFLKAAAWSTLATWTVTAVAWPLAVVLTVNLQQLSRWWLPDMGTQIVFRIPALIAAITIVLLVWTWKRKLDCLYVGLIGSKWIEAAVAWGSIPISYCLCAFVATIYFDPLAHYAMTLTLWPWLLGILIVVRVLTAAWSLREVMRRGLVKPKTVARWATAWLLLASLLFALLLTWAVPLEVAPLHHFAFAVLFALPMVRLAAAPLALAWNRHR